MLIAHIVITYIPYPLAYEYFPSYAGSVRGKWEGFLDRFPMWTQLWNYN